jgi:putative peptidoglycan lipid II flippase
MQAVSQKNKTYPGERNMDKPNKYQSVARSAVLMSLGTFLSRILGLLRDVVLAAYFSRTVTDAFVVAFGFPNKFRRLLGEGSLSASFIPVYIETKEKSPEQAKQLKNGIFTLLTLVSSLICVLGIVFMEPILKLLVGGKGFMAVEGKFSTTIILAQIMFSYLFFITTYAYGMAILNAHKQFFVAAFAPALFNLTFILVALFPLKEFHIPGEILAWAVIVGGIVQAIVVIVPLYRQDLLPKLTWKWKSKNVLFVLKNMIPGILGMGVLQFLTLVNTYYASRLQEGTHSYIYWADRILELPQSLIAVSLGAALLPTLSQLHSTNKKEDMIKTGQHHLLTLLFLTLPSAVGMYLLAQPIVEVLYLRGQFTIKDAESTAIVVRFYAILLIALNIIRVLSPNFYAIKNTWIPALSSVAGVLIHVIIGHFLVNQFGLFGLISSMTLSGYLNLIFILFFYIYYIGKLDLKYILKGILSFVPPLVVMGVVCVKGYSYLFKIQLFGVTQYDRLFALIVTIGFSIIIYFYLSARMHVPQAKLVFNKFKKAKKS